MNMKIGKIDNETLERLVLGRTGAKRDEVIVGPGIGEDCAVLDFGEYECVLSTDPITAGASRVGTLAVHISCNDVASNGVEPMAIMLTVLLPPSVTEKEIEEIARQADEAAKELGVQIIGGHTEVTDIVTQPLISAVAIGRKTKEDVPCVSVIAAGSRRLPADLSFSPPTRSREDSVHAARLVPGDLIIVTKKLALEGTALAAERKEKELKPYLTEEELAYAMDMIRRISVVKEGVIAGRMGIETMHDVTEGGVLGAVWEVCECAGVGAVIEAGSLPFDEVTMTICAVLGLDPMRLISSGSMLMCVPERLLEEVSEALSDAGIELSIIGRVTERESGATLVFRNGERETIGPPGPDEIYSI